MVNISAPALKYAIGNSASTTLAVAAANSDTSMTITSDTNFAAKSGAGMVIVDESQATEEIIYSASKTGAALSTPLANRGLEGGSAQAHAINATVKGILTAGMWNDMIDSLLNVLDQTTGAVDTTKVVTLTGTQTLTNKTLTSPKVGTSIADTNGNEIIKTPATTSAVNEITVTNAATLGSPTISATGGDDNINLTLTAKGTGKVLLDGYYQTPQTYTPDAAGTSTLDLSTGNEHRITMPAGNITIAISNEVSGQKFIVSILQDSGGSRTVTWFTTIRWAGGSAPTLTTTASKRDVFGFICTGTDTYDGFIVGQNL